MGKFYESVPDNLRDWALQQPLFFTASAPLTGRHINVSPKGMPSSTFTVFDANHCAYVDMTGSGSETIAHIYENGRVTLCWCSFDSTPRIMRWFCTGRVIEYDSPSFNPMLDRMDKQRPNGARAIILLSIFKVQTSCGMSVPLLGKPQARADELVNDSGAKDGAPLLDKTAGHFVDRQSLWRWAGNMEEKEKMLEYRQTKNSVSLDGLGGMKAPRRALGQRLWVRNVRASFWRAWSQKEGFVMGFLVCFLVMVMMVKGFGVGGF